MNADELLSQFTIPTPCPANWSRMQGDDQVRLCSACGKHVYNFSAMTSGEGIALIRAQGGELCGRLYRRPDGTLVTSDCPPQHQSAPQSWQFRIRSIMVVIAGFATVFSVGKRLSEELFQQLSAQPSQLSEERSQPSAPRSIADDGQHMMGMMMSPARK